jgi:hypothetical protein
VFLWLSIISINGSFHTFFSEIVCLHGLNGGSSVMILAIEMDIRTTFSTQKYDADLEDHLISKPQLLILLCIPST